MDAGAETPLPTTAPPTPGDVLRRIAGADGTPWFPSDYAKESGVPRDDLNDPLNDLRNAGLVIVLDWVKGRGQGYGLTPDGQRAAADPAALARALAADLPPLAPRDVPVAHPELPPAQTRDPGGLTTFDRGELARQALFSPRPPVVTPFLILANLAWFAVGMVIAWRTPGGGVGAYLRGWENAVLIKLGGVYGEALTDVTGWWRLAACCFAHAGGLHLLLNLYVLGVIGPVAEGLWGRWRFAVIYAWAGLAGSCLAMALRPETLVVGASGAVWGVMAAEMAWLILNREYLPPEVVIDRMKMLGLVLVVNLAVSFAPRVSWEAHLGGGAVGFATAVLANAVRPGLVRKRVLVPAALALGLIPAACLTGLAAYAEVGRGWEPVRERAATRQRLQQRLQFLTAVRPVLTPIDPGAVEAVYRDAVEWAAGRAKPTDLADRAKALRAAAAAAAGGLGPAPGDDPAAQALRERAVAYAQAVGELAAALEAAAAAPEPPAAWRPIAEQKKLVDRRWAELAAG
jgi:membrane associated rhomboid family serine protease